MTGARAAHARVAEQSRSVSRIGGAGSATGALYRGAPSAMGMVAATDYTPMGLFGSMSWEGGDPNTRPLAPRKNGRRRRRCGSGLAGSPPRYPLAGSRQPFSHHLDEGALLVVDLLHLGRSEVHPVRACLHPGRVLLNAAQLLPGSDDHTPTLRQRRAGEKRRAGRRSERPNRGPSSFWSSPSRLRSPRWSGPRSVRLLVGRKPA